MTLSLPSSARPLAIVGALAWTALTIGTAITPTPAQAAEGAFYRAELAAPASKTNPVASGVVWNCNQTACGAPKGTSRAQIVCARLAKQVGEVTAFTAGGKALEAQDLAACNRK